MAKITPESIADLKALFQDNEKALGANFSQLIDFFNNNKVTDNGDGTFSVGNTIININDIVQEADVQNIISSQLSSHPGLVTKEQLADYLATKADDSKVSTLQTQVDNSVVGTNLLVGTGNSSNIPGKNISNQTTNDYLLTNEYNVSSLASAFGTQFTISFDWSVSGSSPSGTFNAIWNRFPWGSGMGNSNTVSSSNTSGHFSTTFSLSTDSENIATGIHFRLDNFVGTLTISNVKLEKGSVATDWCPNPSEILTGALSDFKMPGKTLADKINDEFNNRGVNVKWFGAIGDGTTDDTEVIQDVINKYENVYIPAGTYLISTLLIDKKTFIHGAGQDTTILKSKDESDKQMINLTLSASRSRISDLYLQGGDSWDNRYNSKLGLVLSSDGTLANQDTMIVITKVTVNFFFDNFTIQEGHRGVVCDQLNCGGAGHKNIIVEGTDNSLINCSSAMSMDDGIYVYGPNNRLTSCKSFMAGMSKTSGAGIRVNGSFISMANCELQENYLCNLYLINCSSSNIIGIMLDGAGAHNDTGSLYYKDAEFNNASIPICNLRTHNCHANNISATITNGKTVNNNSWIAAIGYYTLYPKIDTKNNINLTSINIDPTPTDTYQIVDLPAYYWLNNSLTINGSNTINDVNHELSHGFNVYSYTLSSGLTITNNQNLNGTLAVSSDEYQLKIGYPKNTKQLSLSFDYDYDKNLGDQLFSVFDVMIACEDSSGNTQYYISKNNYLQDLMHTLSISDILPNTDYGEIKSVTGRFRFKNTSASTTSIAVKNLKTLIVTGVL